MSILEATILSIVEGIAEFLPISSTGHLVLLSRFLDLPATDFNKSFIIAIQLGAILSIVIIYWREIFLNQKIWPKIVAAFVPTAIIGFLVYPFLKNYLLDSEPVILSALFFGGVAMILFEMFYKEKDREESDIADIEKMSYGQAALVGCFQALAIIPGVSRSAATILGGLSLGMSRPAIVVFSFLLAIPTMFAATGYDLYKTAGSFNGADFKILAIGFVLSFIFAWLSVKGLLYFIKRFSFAWFGWYRIGLVVLWVLWLYML